MFTHSPLRYPGGKARLANYVKLILAANNLMDGHYVEPYTGGGSVALALLYGDYVRRIHINDADPSVHAFWYCVLHRTSELCELIRDAKMTTTEWLEQRRIYRSDETDPLIRGFATFYLNRTNRSGIIVNGGVIGGLPQAGKWKMDVRFPIDELVRRIEEVARYRSRITLTNLDALDLLRQLGPNLPPRSLVYLDPPYYVKGQELYANAYQPEGHAEVAVEVKKLSIPWMVSYDDHPDLHSLYASHRMKVYDLGYSASTKYQGQEVIFFSDELKIPDVEKPTNVPQTRINAAVSAAAPS